MELKPWYRRRSRHIEPGKQADMIVLSDNPVDDISNTKKIEAVINNGQFIDEENHRTSSSDTGKAYAPSPNSYLIY